MWHEAVYTQVRITQQKKNQLQNHYKTKEMRLIDNEHPLPFGMSWPLVSPH